MNNMNDMITRIRELQKTINGDPQQFLQSYIRQNNIPQSALDYAQQQAGQMYETVKNLMRH